jgi:hypothetical protein
VLQWELKDDDDNDETKHFYFILRSASLYMLSLSNMHTLHREDVYSVDRFHGSALYGDRCTAGCELHMNFADESACLNSQITGGVEDAVPLRVDIFRDCFVKKHRSNNPSCTYSTPDTNFQWMERVFVG